MVAGEEIVMEAREVLGRIGLFADVLSSRQLDQLAARCRALHYNPGTVLMTEGDLGAFMVAIVSGRLEVSVAGSRQARRKIAILGPGDVVGEMSLMTGARRAATVTSLEASEVIEINKVAIEAMFQNAPDLLDRFGAMLAVRKAELDRVSDEEAARGGLGQRTHEIIGAMRRFFGRDG